LAFAIRDQPIRLVNYFFDNFSTILPKQCPYRSRLKGSTSRDYHNFRAAPQSASEVGNRSEPELHTANRLTGLDAGSAVCLLFLGLAALVNLSRLRLVRLGERDTLNESLKL